MIYTIIVKKQTDSTNEDIQKFFHTKEKEGLVILTQHQKKGRGRSGAWHDDSQGMLLFSLLLRPQLRVRDYLRLNHCSIQSLKESISEEADKPLDLSIKWPNDLLLNKKKIAGILQEGIVQKETLKAVALGIGINVLTKHSFFKKHHLNHASSLRIEHNQSWNKDILFKKFLKKFHHNYKKILL